ncbi:substrate-binding domain-containing protein [Bradyrhizobium sp. WD16]|uniref:substrate-binding domain-containing protein n=1 Tax=Bradyrhizobium sp. WD16 TaxID=1521768 RepID=UPI0020A58B1D|nr:substrate-binding domain-containing protein [Bradyrhizobium sp. WD16]
MSGITFCLPRACVAVVVAAAAAAGLVAPAPALTLQGSTTFTMTVVEPHAKAVEDETGIGLEIIPNKSSLGLLALFEHKADLAMISAGLAKEIQLLKEIHPDLPFEQLNAAEIARTRAAFVVHPANPVRRLPLASIRRILTGEVVNWKAFGGADLPIRVVVVRTGGGVLASVEAALLGSGHISTPDAIRVQVGTQILKVVAQEPAALGITQFGLVRRGSAVELETDQPIEQILSLVSLGEPSSDDRRVIEAMRRRMETER